jgi:hypothetical protein
MKILAYLKAAYDNLVAYIKPDPRPDPEDAQAYAFVDEVLKEYEVQKEHYQMLKGGGQPSDVVKKAPPQLIAKAPLGWTWWVDVYDGPIGRGYQICFETKRAGVVYRKVVNDGPEEWREQDWTEVKEVIIGT